MVQACICLTGGGLRKDYVSLYLPENETQEVWIVETGSEEELLTRLLPAAAAEMTPGCMSVDLRGAASAFGGGEADLFSSWPPCDD